MVAICWNYFGLWISSQASGGGLYALAIGATQEQWDRVGEIFGIRLFTEWHGKWMIKGQI